MRTRLAPLFFAAAVVLSACGGGDAAPEAEPGGFGTAMGVWASETAGAVLAIGTGPVSIDAWGVDVVDGKYVGYHDTVGTNGNAVTGNGFAIVDGMQRKHTLDGTLLGNGRGQVNTTIATNPAVANSVQMTRASDFDVQAPVTALTGTWKLYDGPGTQVGSITIGEPQDLDQLMPYAPLSGQAQGCTLSGRIGPATGGDGNSNYYMMMVDAGSESACAAFMPAASLSGRAFLSASKSRLPMVLSPNQTVMKALVLER